MCHHGSASQVTCQLIDNSCTSIASGIVRYPMVAKTSEQPFDSTFEVPTSRPRHQGTSTFEVSKDTIKTLQLRPLKQQSSSSSTHSRQSRTSLCSAPSPSGVGQAFFDIFTERGADTGICFDTGIGPDISPVGDRTGGGDVGPEAAAPAAPRYILDSASSLASLVQTAPFRPSWETTVERRRSPPEAEEPPAAARSLRRVMKEK